GSGTGGGVGRPGCRVACTVLRCSRKARVGVGTNETGNDLNSPLCSMGCLPNARGRAPAAGFTLVRRNTAQGVVLLPPVIRAYRYSVCGARSCAPQTAAQFPARGGKIRARGADHHPRRT